MDEKILLRVWPEFGSTGIWSPPSMESNVMGMMVSYESLQLPDDLVTAFRVWQDKYDERPLPDDGTFDWEAFEDDGLELAKRLKDYKVYCASVQCWMAESWQTIYGYDVMADYCASLWDDDGASLVLKDIEDDLGGYMIPDKETLQKEFDRWETEFDKSLDNTLNWETFNTEGRRLASELQSRLPRFCVVGYSHAFEETFPPFKAAPTAT